MKKRPRPHSGMIRLRRLTWNAPKELRHFQQTRILAEEGQAHLRRALELGGGASMLSDLLLEARLLDYAGMKNIYAAELAGFWRGLGSHPEPDRVSFYLTEASSHDHSRIEDLMDYSG